MWKRNVRKQELTTDTSINDDKIQRFDSRSWKDNMAQLASRVYKGWDVLLTSLHILDGDGNREPELSKVLNFMHHALCRSLSRHNVVDLG